MRAFVNKLRDRQVRWQWLVASVFGTGLLGSAIFLAARYNPRPEEARLQRQVQQLSSQLQQLRQEQSMPAMVLTHYRNSICYIYGVYHVGFPNQRPGLRARISGTGFVVSDGLLATNRHVAEPWYEDPESSQLLRRGARPQLEKLVAFFPGLSTAVDITPAVLSAQGD